MSVLEKSNVVIITAIEQLVEEFELKSRFLGLGEPDSERKVQIAKDIAKLRASMEPKCTCKK